MFRLTLILAFLLIVHNLFAQRDKSDTLKFVSLIQISYSLNATSGDMQNRFGNVQNAGLGYAAKFKKNWYLGGQFNYMFGGNVKEDNMLDHLLTSQDGIITDAGDLLTPFMELRGYSAFLHFGKIYNPWNKLANYGFIAYAGPGYLAHWIKIDYRDGNLPQLKEELVRGYDRLSSGFAFNEFIGFTYLGKRKIANFFIGLDLVQSWTTSLREYNFDTRSVDDIKRFDAYMGFRVGWILPLYKSTGQEFYYY